MTTVWLLLILLPNEAAGRTVGPFATQEQCQVAERIYSDRLVGRFAPPFAKCVQAKATGEQS